MGRARCIQIHTLAALLALAGCVTGAGEQQVGDEEAKKVEQEMGLVQQPALQAYVRAVGERLVAVSERPAGPWQFEVVDRPEPNAFALPGGHVFVTRGLLVLLNSEDELAGVLGHEIAHVTASHSTKRMGAVVATAPITIATGLAGFAVGIVSPVLGSAVAGSGELITGGLVIAPFSREQEHEADELGQALAARAGYDPIGIARFLHTLDRDLALQGGEKATFHFLDSHPLTPDREARTRGTGEPAGARYRAADRRRTRRVPRAAGGNRRRRGPGAGRVRGQPLPAAGARSRDRLPGRLEDAEHGRGRGRDQPGAGRGGGAARRRAELDPGPGARRAGEEAERRELRALQGERAACGARESLRSGKVTEIVLIEYRRNVYGVVGQCGDAVAKNYTRVFRATAGSFRALRASERSSIRESRLRVRSAQARETPAGIAKRTGSTWNGERVAVANEVELDARFDAGWAVKVALSQAYESSGRPPRAAK